MDATEPFEKPISKSEFSGYWIPSHNAKVAKAGIEANAAPFLPDANGNIKAESIYNASTGHCLQGSRLIPVQFKRMKKAMLLKLSQQRLRQRILKVKSKQAKRAFFTTLKTRKALLERPDFTFQSRCQTRKALSQKFRKKSTRWTTLKTFLLP